MRILLWLSLLPALCSCGGIFPPPGPVRLDANAELLRPGPQMEYCIDPSGSLTLETVQACEFTKVRAYYPSFGITTDAVWVRFRIEPDKNVSTSWYFELANTLPRSVAFYRVADSGKVLGQVSYEAVPPRERLVPHHYFIFPITDVTEPETIYLRGRSIAGLNMPVFLWNARAFPMRDMLRTFWFSVFFGIMFAMSLYNLFLFISIRDRSYLYYVFYILFVTEYFALISGYIAYLVPDSWIGYLPVLGPVVALVATIFALLFARKFLLLAEKDPLLAKAANVVLALHILSLASLPFIPVTAAAHIGNALPLAGIAVILVSAVRLIRAGFKPARYFLIAWSFLMVGVSLFILMNLNLIPSGFTAQYGQFFGAAFEAVLLSLALGYRINSLRAAEQEARRDLVQEQSRALAEQTEMAESFARFVPAEFLEYLGKKSIVSVSQGDVVRKQMAVLFLDIRGFTRMSETLGSEATFAFLNRFHGGLEPLIQKHGGFIDKFIGDAIMALFPHPAASVQAAIEMQEWTQQSDTRIGVGIHYGELMLGTVGSPRRLETTVIGDTVNLASRIESINKQYGTQIVISDAVYKHIQSNPEIHSRELDAIRVRGKKQPVVLFEVLNSLPQAVLDARLAHMSLYMTGLLAFRTGDFDAARAQFQEYLNLAGEDPVVRMYLARLDAVRSSSTWDGIWEAEA